jgi:hypothetical protein
MRNYKEIAQIIKKIAIDELVEKKSAKLKTGQR